MRLRKGRGVSTVLGTLIFIGILFSAVIPMFLVMKQADTIYTQKVHEMENRDEERASEVVEAYGYPVNETSSELMVRVANNGVVPIKIVRIWVNDVDYSQNTMVASLETEVLGPFPVSLKDGTSYVVKVTTERGNVFASTAGTLYFTDGYWFTPSLGIHVLVLNWVGKYKISIYNITWHPEGYETQGIDFGDIEWSQLVDEPGGYTVSVMKKKGGDWVPLPGTPIGVVITWPGGSRHQCDSRWERFLRNPLIFR